MKNTSLANLSFCYQGKTFELSIQLDWDKLLKQYDSFPPLYSFFAKEHNYDFYSYQYEVMQEEEIEFSEIQGDWLLRYINENSLDIVQIASNWAELRVGVLLQPIAEQILGINDLTQEPKIKQALTEAFLIGRQHG